MRYLFFVGLAGAMTAAALAGPVPRQAGPLPGPAPGTPVVTVTSTERPAVDPLNGKSGMAGWVTAVDRASITIHGMLLPFSGVGGDIRRMSQDPTGAVYTYVGWPLKVFGWGSDCQPIRLDSSRDRVVMTFWSGERRVVRLADEPQRRFLVGPELAAGSQYEEASAHESYPLAAVRVGDYVEIGCASSGPPAPLYNYCRTISIRRRPGGKVPPAPAQDPTANLIFHEQMQADQDWEERQAAYPYKYHPGRCGDFCPPQLGPMPREVKPKP